MEETSDLANLRNDLHRAGRLLEAWIPSAQERIDILRCLAASIRIAHERSAGARWGLNLNPDFVRLTVGMVNQFGIDRSGGAFFMASSELAPPAMGAEVIEPSTYARLPGAWVVSGPAHSVAAAYARLASAHEEAIARTARTQFQPGVRLSHSPALLSHLRELLHEPIPDPTWHQAPSAPDGLGLRPYMRASEDLSLAPPLPSAPDVRLLERSHIAHNRTQNALADFLRRHGLAPLSPAPEGPQFDLAWRSAEGILSVAEVKSIAEGSATDQLRLGLGQVLEYRFRLSQQFGEDVRAHLIVEAAPGDLSWRDICEACGVTLSWPPDFPLLP